MPSFTVQLANLHELGPIVEVRILVGSDLESIQRAANQPVPAPVIAHAMIDTGATGTVIREDIPERLGIHPVGVTSINTPSSTNVKCYEYVVRLLFPNQVIVELPAIAAPLQG